MIISRTPFRISFLGGGTDFPGFFNEHGGCTLSTSINQYCYILLHPTNPCLGYTYKASYAEMEQVQELAQLRHPLIRETLRHLTVSDGLEIDHVADLPGRTGLGSSSSFTVGLLLALHRMRSQPASREQLAQEAIHIERTLVGDPGGHQDQYAAAFGGLNRIDYAADSIAVTPLALAPDRRRELASHMLMFYMGRARSSAPILKDQQKRLDTNVPGLLRMKALVNDAQQTLVSGRDMREMGELLHAAWQIKKTFTSKISNTRIDEAYAAARRTGAWGGKLLGAGGGGFLMLLAPPDAHAKIETELADLDPIQIGLDETGATILYADNATT